MDQATDSLARWRSNIYLISQLIQNDVSSTKVRTNLLLNQPYNATSHGQVRLFLRRGLSVRYLLPNAVVDYIGQNELYQDETISSGNSVSDKGKDRDKENNTTHKKDVIPQLY